MKNNNLDGEREFKLKISTIWKSICLVEMCFDALNGITNNLSRENFSRVGFFQLARLAFWRTGIIEFSKLLSSKQNDKYNIRKLLSSLAPNEYWGKLKIDPKTIEEWNKSIQCQEDVINDVLKLRDEVYAHTDAKNLGNDINYNFPSNKEIEQLLNLLKEVVRGLYGNVFTAEINMENSLRVGHEITYIFEAMVEKESIRCESLVKQINNSK